MMKSLLKTSLYHKSTCTGLLMNVIKIFDLIKILVDRVCKIANKWGGFHKNITKSNVTEKEKHVFSIFG